jgi:glucitol/sorbitol PTS system EIIB component
MSDEKKQYNKVKIEHGGNGWGGPLIIEPTSEKKYIVSVTGGGIHSVAKKISELTGGEAYDGFKSSVPFNQMACVVIDCGGNSRVGVFPMKNVLTININGGGPSGPLKQFIKENLFVSDVGLANITLMKK